MNTRRPITLMAVSLAIASISLANCSKDDKAPTSPGPGGTVLNSGTLAAGTGQYVLTFTTAGTFPYHCEIHPIMQGSVQVGASGLDSLIVRIENASASGFVPQAVGGVTIVKPGGYVHWFNVSAQPHTVTGH